MTIYFARYRVHLSDRDRVAQFDSLTGRALYVVGVSPCAVILEQGAEDKETNA